MKIWDSVYILLAAGIHSSKPHQCKNLFHCYVSNYTMCIFMAANADHLHSSKLLSQTCFLMLAPIGALLRSTAQEPSIYICYSPMTYYISLATYIQLI